MIWLYIPMHIFRLEGPDSEPARKRKKRVRRSSGDENIKEKAHCWFPPGKVETCCGVS